MRPIARLLSGQPRNIPVRPSGGSSARLNQNTLGLLGRSSDDARVIPANERSRIEEYFVKQSELERDAQRYNFRSNSGESYSSDEVVGLSFEQQRAYDYFGNGGSNYLDSRQVSAGAGTLNRVIEPDNVVVQPQRYSLLGERTEDLGDLYRNQQFNISQKRSRLNPKEDPITTPINSQREANEYLPASLASSRDYSPEYARQQAQLEQQHFDMFGFNSSTTLSDIFKTKVAKDFIYKSGTEGMESPGFVYNEAIHNAANSSTAAEAMLGGTSGNFIGMFRPDEGVTQSSVSMLNSIGGGANPLFASMGLGALVGGAANYAAGGEFGEGAVAGGLAGGGIAIGARAIRGNASAIEGYMQRQVTGKTGEEAISAIRGMESAPEGLNLMQRGMYNILKSESPSIGMQSRYAVATGSGLSGMMFTGRRNDKRRGFNSHRGNRI